MILVFGRFPALVFTYGVITGAAPLLIVALSALAVVPDAHRTRSAHGRSRRRHAADQSPGKVVPSRSSPRGSTPCRFRPMTDTSQSSAGDARRPPRRHPLDRGASTTTSASRDYIADRSLATAVFLALELGPAAAPRGRGRRRQDRARQGPRGDARRAADPAPVLRGPRRQHRGLRVELPAPDARDPAARGARRGRARDAPTTSSARSS